jgi:xylan 1,4-beta-xylosidase
MHSGFLRKTVWVWVWTCLAAASAVAQVQVSVDWNTTVSNVDPKLWGVNDEQITNPTSTANAGFNQYLTQLNPELIRVHHAGLADDWTDPTTKTWDVAKIKAGFENATGYADAKIMLNVPWWPSWMGSSNTPLPAAQEEAFINLFADLVIIMRDSVKRDVAYWEITNEREDTYARVGQLPVLWNLVNRIADRIRVLNPDAKLGGPALTWANPAWTESFLDICGPNLDFVSWHNYASGTPTTTNDRLFFTLLDQIDGNTKYMLSAIEKRGLNLETYLTEYNVQWTWTPFEIRHANHVGAVFQACYLRRAALRNLNGVTVWHLKGNAYGLIDGSNAQRATGSLYRWGTQYLHGRMAASTVADSTVEVFPVRMPDGKRSMLLMNKTASTRTVIGGGSLLTAGSGETVRAFQINGSGFLPQTLNVGPGDLALAPYSVTLITTAAEDTQAPAAPTNLRATAVTDNSVSLAWTAAADNRGIAGYDLFNGTTRINPTLITGTSYVAEWLNPATTYNLTLRARDNSGLQSVPSATLVVLTGAAVVRQGSAVLSPTHLFNAFGGNVVNDTVQTTSAAGQVNLKQNEVLRLAPTGLPQYQNVFATTFKRTVNLTANATFSVVLKSNVNATLRVKLFDDLGAELDNGQHTLYVTGDNMPRTYNLNFAATGFGSVNPRLAKGIRIMHLGSGSLTGVLYFDNLQVGVKNDDLTPPAAPTGLAAGNITGHSVDLSWNPATDNKGVDGYEVYVGTTRLTPSALTGTTYTATWLEPNTTYAFTVRARDVAGNVSEASAPLPVTTGAFDPKPGSAVRTATTFIHEYRGNVVNDTVQTTSAQGQTTFRQNEELRIEVKSITQWHNVYIATFNRTIDLSGGADFSVRLKSNLGVRVRVKVFDDLGRSIDYWENDITVAGDDTYRTFTRNVFKGGSGSVDRKKVKGVLLMYSNNTPSPAADAVIFVDDLKLGRPDTQVPTVPANLQATVASGSRVDLSWTAATDNIGVYAYKVYNGSTLAGTTGGTTFSATGLTPTGTYTFTVKAADETGNESAPSNAVTVTTPDDLAPSAPANLTASAVTPYGLTLAWQPATDNVGVTGYDVYQDGTKLNAAPLTETTLAVTGLTAGTAYAFSVKAHDAAGNGSAEGLLTATTLPPAAATYQAEHAALYRAKIKTGHAGYAGTGYVDLLGSKGNYLEWTVNGIFEGDYTLAFRYATGPESDDPAEEDVATLETAHLSLSVNGVVIDPQRAFPSTGSLDHWGTLTLTASLRPGANTIRLVTVGGSNPNLDFLTVTNPVREPAAAPGARTAAGTQTIRFEGTALAGLHLYPNPAAGKVVVEVTAARAGEATIALADLFSRKLKSTGRTLEAGRNRVELAVSDLPEGLYLVTVTAEGKAVTRKLVVRR